MTKFIAGTIAALVLLALVYAIDYGVWRVRLATGGNATGMITVQYFYAIQEKNGKTEYDYQPPQSETCVNSLFPHAGNMPCWYERKHTEKEIRI
jgi:hypothetical protein